MGSERARRKVCFAGKPLHGLRSVEAAIVTALLMMSIGPVANAQTAPAPAPAGQSPATPASATDIVGIWQGTLHVPQANRDLRIENKISKDDKGNLKVVDYSIDQGGQPLVANKASFDGGVLTYSIDRIGGKYEGKMCPDGKTITGTGHKDRIRWRSTLIERRRMRRGRFPNRRNRWRRMPIRSSMW